MTDPSGPVNETGRPSGGRGSRPRRVSAESREESTIVVRGILIALALSLAIWGGLALLAYEFAQVVIAVID